MEWVQKELTLNVARLRYPLFKGLRANELEICPCTHDTIPI